MLPCEARILALHGQLHLSRQGDAVTQPLTTHTCTHSLR